MKFLNLKENSLIIINCGIKDRMTHGFSLENARLFNNRRRIRESGRSSLDTYYKITQSVDPDFEKTSEVQKKNLGFGLEKQELFNHRDYLNKEGLSALELDYQMTIDKDPDLEKTIEAQKEAYIKK
jgi:hypothetical protein